MEYKVSEVISFSEQTYGKFANHRIAFKVEGNNNYLSAFAKQNFTVGQVISGDIVSKDVNGKTYWNFEFAKKTDEKYEKLANTVTGLQIRVAVVEGQVQRLLAGDKETYPVNDKPMPFPTEDDGVDMGTPF